VFTGTVAEIEVVPVRLSIESLVVLNLSLLLPGTESKSVPVIVTLVPATPIVGENPVILRGLATMKEKLEIAEPLGEDIEIGPLVAPAGTRTEIWVGLDEFTIAVESLNATVFCSGVLEKPVP